MTHKAKREQWEAETLLGPLLRKRRFYELENDPKKLLIDEVQPKDNNQVI